MNLDEPEAGRRKVHTIELVFHSSCNGDAPNLLTSEVCVCLSYARPFWFSAALILFRSHGARTILFIILAFNRGSVPKY
jgi:hypothetical protein